MPFISVVVQRVITDVDGNIAQVINRERMLTSSLEERGLNSYPIIDPVPVPDSHISVAGIGVGIEQAVRHWIVEAYPGAYLEGTKVYLPG